MKNKQTHQLDLDYDSWYYRNNFRLMKIDNKPPSKKPKKNKALSIYDNARFHQWYKGVNGYDFPTQHINHSKYYGPVLNR